MTTTTIQCPCGTEIDVPLNLALEENEDGRQCITMDPDLSDLWAHSFTHDGEPKED